MIKPITLFFTICIGPLLFSQIIIGGTTGTAADKTSVLLEFEGQNKGIILPYTRTLPTSPTEGTLLLDASVAAEARVRYYNGSWIDLSGQNADITSSLSIQPTSSQVPENADTKSIIGSDTSAADGVLVLESQTKAMVLPSVESTDTIPNPSPGMIVYINKSGAKRLAVFNGSKWSYWMP
ncbi:hypothetical protein EGI16_07255 [Chryseobacterium sp. G0240]|uniref:hypothetical protein n=1 Tax=Chryseobacterium sp. G0240 TaxID=2487066 RepID=UPI000F45AE97|nr:hypothetical protein [Chryseobacterium sp. G0240]ROI05109.1 hypothetical protein EGI16_07255 [Chryseobacterium sp. G0240]